MISQNQTFLNDFTKSDFNLDFSVFFCMAFPKCLQSSTDMINLRFTASLWTLLLDKQIASRFSLFCTNGTLSVHPLLVAVTQTQIQEAKNNFFLTQSQRVHLLFRLTGISITCCNCSFTWPEIVPYSSFCSPSA